ncbi:MAG TPA: hypothetical protein VFR24_14350 [Candidatus Angelobacter sp.]|nr:hypothetical protein [Candidatus Angelobacter sp.]
MAEINTTEWLAVLEAVARRPPDEANAEWEWLMDQLGLGPEYFLAIYAAIRQGRWRTANNPKAYLKTVAKREASKIDASEEGNAELVFPGEIERDGEEISQEERLDSMQHELDSATAMQAADGVWRPGGKRRDQGNYRDLLLTGVPGELRVIEQPSQELREVIEQINASTDEIHIHLRPFIKANWKEWARAAGLDQWEQQVLRCKLDGVSRERALAGQRDETSRRALQAAWRRFDRNGARRLLEAAKKISEKNVPE